MESPAKHSYLRWASCLGATPLILGSAIFIAWCASGAKWLEVAGLFNIFGGGLLFLVGVYFVLFHLIDCLDDGRLRKWRTWASTILVLAVLFANFPVCGSIMNSVSRIEKGERAKQMLRDRLLFVLNDSGERVHLRIVGPEGAKELGSLTVGADVCHWLTAPRDAQMTLRVLQDTATRELILPPQSAGADTGDSVAIILRPNGIIRTAATPRPSSYTD